MSQAQPSNEGGELYELDPFTVRSSNDLGYRKVNAITATKIGASIHDTPLNISVVGEELVNDLAIDNTNDLFGYVSSIRSSYDVPVGISQGTSDGGTRIRGFRTTIDLSGEGEMEDNCFDLIPGVAYHVEWPVEKGPPRIIMSGNNLF